MFRARRYRSILIFTSIFVLVFFYFSRSRDWGASVTSNTPQPVVDRPDSQYQNPAAGGSGGGSKEVGGAPPPYNIPKPSPATIPKPDPKKLPGDAVQAPVPVIPPPAVSKVPTKPSTPHDSSHGYGEEYTSGGKKKPGSGYAGAGLKGQGQGQGDLDVLVPETDQTPAFHWEKPKEQFPLAKEDLIKLPTGRAKTLPKLQASGKDESASDRMQRMQRQGAIKQAFKHAWSGYKSVAMGHDEVLPIQGGHKNPFNGWGATLVDTLDTLWIMDMKDEFSMALDYVKKIDFTSSVRKDIPVFETVIRYMGGLIAAYDISGHKYNVLLDKAVELAEILIGTFDTPNRMPMLFYKLVPEQTSQPHLGRNRSVLAELGSLSLEFTRLAQLTKEDKYYDAIARITNALEQYQSETGLPGLWPMEIDATGCKQPNTKAGSEFKAPSLEDVGSYNAPLKRRGKGGLEEDAQPANYDEILRGNTNGGKFLNQAPDIINTNNKECTGGLKTPHRGNPGFGIGAPGDSTYEYLPKEYMLLGGVNEQYRTMYEKAMDTARSHLLFQPMTKDDRDILFLASARLSGPSSTEEAPSLSYMYEGSHLACFAGGMFGIGAKLFGIKDDLDIASKLTDGCVWAYQSTNSGIMPEKFTVLPCEKGEPCTWNETAYNLALDPHADRRIAEAERFYQEVENAGPAIIAQDRDVGVNDPAYILHDRYPVYNPQISPMGKAIPPAKRWQVQPTPTPTPAPNVKARKGGAPNHSVHVGSDISALSHEDYVKAMIRDERLPPGMVSIPGKQYLLRPEAIESVFIMYRLTGDDYWRERGWEMFDAINKNTLTELANSAIYDVTADEVRFLDRMESFWLAETLKYFYLLFSDPSVVSLDEYVLSTEAHPFKRPQY